MHVVDLSQLELATRADHQSVAVSVGIAVFVIAVLGYLAVRVRFRHK